MSDRDRAYGCPKTKIMLFFYIRHGDPVYDPDSLTPLGQRQAESVAKRLALYGLDEIYASTSSRAIMTATPTSEILKKEIKTLDFANESHAWSHFTVTSERTGKPTFMFHSGRIKDIFRSPELQSLGERWYEHPRLSEDAERIKAGIELVRRESDAFFESLGYRHLGGGKYEVVNASDKRIALFAHQGFGMAFIPTLLGLTYPQFATRFDFSHTGMTVISFDNEDGYAYPRLLTLSNDSHLFRDGLPTRYNNGKYF